MLLALPGGLPAFWGTSNSFFSRRYPRVAHLSQMTAEVIERYKIYRTNSWVNPNGQEVGSEDDIMDYTRKGARRQTINYELKVLTNLFNTAINWGYGKENPTRKVKRLKVRDSKPVRFLTRRECKRLLAACPTNLYPVYFTLLNTGMRKSELINLEWTDIDVRRKKIKIQGKPFWQPKSNEREIPINSALHKLLKDLKQKNERALKSNFVFPHCDGGLIRVKLRDKLVVIAKRAGIANLTNVHTLRHTFASHLVMSGVDLPTVMKLMGHSDIQTTMIYAHLAPDHLAAALNNLSFQ